MVATAYITSDWNIKKASQRLTCPSSTNRADKRANKDKVQNINDVDHSANTDKVHNINDHLKNPPHVAVHAPPAAFQISPETKRE